MSVAEEEVGGGLSGPGEVAKMPDEEDPFKGFASSGHRQVETVEEER